MKQRAKTVDGVRLEPHWFRGYVGEIDGKRVVVRQDGRDWIVSEVWPWTGSVNLVKRRIGGGRTMREAVRMARGAP
jgi:hypothetical protein